MRVITERSEAVATSSSTTPGGTGIGCSGEADSRRDTPRVEAIERQRLVMSNWAKM